MGNWLVRDLDVTCLEGKTAETNSFSGMDEAFLRFPHIPEQIFEQLDFKSLMNSRVVARSWKQFIDAREQQWYPFKNEIAEMKGQCWDGETPFHEACQNGPAGIADIIIKNSAKLNIDLNAKNNSGWTAFHYACYFGQSKIAEMIMKNSVKFNIELNAKDNYGSTAFHFACRNGSTTIVDMMVNNSESLKLDLTARDNSGWSGFQWAQAFGRTDIINLIQTQMPQIAV